MRLTAIACCGAVLLCAGTETYGEGESEDSSFLAADASASTGSLGELAVSLDSTNLPIVMITTGGQTIPYGTKITATMRIIDHAPGVRNHPTDPDAEYDGYIGIEVRGHCGWKNAEDTAGAFGPSCRGTARWFFSGKDTESKVSAA